MSKYHIGLNGPAKCVAQTPESCHYGGTEHFDNQESAVAMFEEVAEVEHIVSGDFMDWRKIAQSRDPEELRQIGEIMLKRSEEEFKNAKTVYERDMARTKAFSARFLKDRTNAPEGLPEKDIPAETFKNGGMTYDPISKAIVTNGFAYSPYKEKERRFSRETFSLKDIDDYIVDNIEQLIEPGHKLGVWYDEDGTGDVFLDVSVVGTNASEVRKACHENDQLAFFDIGALEEVRTDFSKEDESTYMPEK